MLAFTVISIFPEMFASPLQQSILKKAQEKELISVRLVDPRDYTKDRHRVVDDYPYGGGQGMVLKPEPLIAAIEGATKGSKRPRVILLSPQGSAFTQEKAKALSTEDDVVLVCGRYEGVDERVKEFCDEELSIGDYTLGGGELPAMVVIDAVTRLIPGVLGNVKSAEEDSFAGGLLEYPQYTRPEEFRGLKVPEVLLSGDHEKVKEWRRKESLHLTWERRPDLLAGAKLTSDERRDFDQRVAPVYLALLHHPVYDKNHEVVTTSITNMDIHDIARAARSYGVQGFYIVHPVKALQKLANKIIHHWEEGFGSRYNQTRKEALMLVRITDTLDDVILEVEREHGVKPQLVGTSAKSGGNRTSFAALREMLRKDSKPFLILFGTGWGLTETVLARSDYILESIEGRSDYNHLPVRSAAAIILDRLLRRY
jgi:tRNA (guanine37-N1)-methyltransferase